MSDAPKTDTLKPLSIPLTPSVHELIASNAEFWRTQALLKAVEVDRLRGELAKAAAQLEEAQAIIAAYQGQEPEGDAPSQSFGLPV